MKRVSIIAAVICAFAIPMLYHWYYYAPRLHSETQTYSLAQLQAEGRYAEWCNLADKLIPQGRGGEPDVVTALFAILPSNDHIKCLCESEAWHREELLEVGQTLFNALAKEPTFIDAWINTAVDQPDLIVVYERWNESKESFVQNILPKPFYGPYLALLEQVGLGREVYWLEERGSWPA